MSTAGNRGSCGRGSKAAARTAVGSGWFGARYDFGWNDDLCKNYDCAAEGDEEEGVDKGSE